jgi:release factor glutamine methyltransferase
MLLGEVLAKHNIGRADAEVLLSRILGKPRTWLLAHPEYALSPAERANWAAWALRRQKLEPVAYITGEQEFYGRGFHVDARVLIPRPDTEHVVEFALRFLQDREPREEEVDTRIIITAARGPVVREEPRLIVDAGTGSGCIAISLALERPDLRVIATDISDDALAVARMNAERHGVLDRVKFRQGDGLEPVTDIDEPFLLVSNPPYIPDGTPLMTDVAGYEPHVALFGGDGGGVIARRIVMQAAAHPQCVGWVLECETGQLG